MDPATLTAEGAQQLPRQGPRIAEFTNSYATLPERFFARIGPAHAPAPRLIAFNRPLARELGVDVGDQSEETLASIFVGNLLPAGASPIAMAYAGHQFGHFVPQLGDGRAVLLGEVGDSSSSRRDIQLKGSGRTPFSRNGDGRAALGPVLREYLVSEAMHALGVPGTRALAAVATGEEIRREGTVPGAVFTRVAASHVRVGTFQYFAARDDAEAVQRLADYVIERHYPSARAADNPYRALLEAVADRQASLVARWMHVGFIHGVMNTDNMAVSGETIDFGPCAFMDNYEPATVFSSIDAKGRYAYANQPHAAQWNLARFAETLLPLLDADTTQAVDYATGLLTAFPTRFAGYWLAGMRAKLGLTANESADSQLVQEFLELMHRNEADYTLAFRGLCAAARSPQNDAAVRSLFANPLAYDEWASRWRQRLAADGRTADARAAAMALVNPAVIPRNHRIEQVIAAAVGRNDFAPFHDLLDALSRPYDEAEARTRYAEAPLPAERVTETFCGT